MNYVVKISENDRNEIERKYYLAESIANLLDRLGNKTIAAENGDILFEKYLNEYSKAFKEYSIFGKYLEQKYIPEEVAGKASEWHVEFETSSMTFNTEE